MKKSLLLLLGVVVILGLVLCKKEEEPETGAISVKSTPTGATIFLDGDDTGEKTDAILDELEPDDYTVKLTLAGYEDYEEDVTVVAGDTVEVDATLQALPPEYGALQVSSTPSGAAIWLDGEDTGEQTNALLDSLLVGTYTLKLTLQDYNDFDTTVTIVKDETTTVNVALTEKTGSIQVNSTPDGATIWLDGVNTGYVTDYLLTEVSLGGHTVKLTLEGYEDWETTVTVSEGETETIDATLEESPPEEITLIEDEADPSGGWGLALSSDGHKMAVKFTPPSYPFEITKAIYAAGSWADNPDDWQDPGDLVFFTPNMQGYPGTEVGRKQFTPDYVGDFNEYDVTDLDITINSGSFFFAIECIKDYGTLPGYPSVMLDFSKPVHHASWAYTTFTNPDSTWDGWLPFDDFRIGSSDWPEDMSAGDSVDLIIRVKGLVPGSFEVTLTPDTRSYPTYHTPKATLPVEQKYEILDWRSLR